LHTRTHTHPHWEVSGACRSMASGSFWSARRLKRTNNTRFPDEPKKKPTWWNTRRHSTTSAYSSTGPPARPGCPSSSFPTTSTETEIGADRNQADSVPLIILRVGAVKARAIEALRNSFLVLNTNRYDTAERASGSLKFLNLSLQTTSRRVKPEWRPRSTSAAG
jgi:hypothetical protein